VKALEGLRVVELGGYAAGPVVGKYLGNFGAEVIRIESRLRLDGFRGHYPPFKDNQPGPERAGIFNFFNDGKRSVSLNLKSEPGANLARELIARSDVVVENFTPGTMQRLGLGYPTLAERNPKLVMLSTCNQGQTGPRATQPGFGSHLTSLSGFTHLLGEPERAPALLYGPYIDYIAVGFGTIAVLAALARRRRTGRGAHIDLSQYEAGLQFLAPALLEYFVTGRVATRHGNRDQVAAPHGVYPCRGIDRWLSLSVHDDAEWRCFVTAIGQPEWTLDTRFATQLRRKENESELDQQVGRWTCTRERDDAVRSLREFGLKAAPVNSMEDLFEDPQLLDRGTWRCVTHPVLGQVRVMAPPFELSDTPAHIDHPAPLLGEHTSQVLRNVLGLDAAQIETLERAGALT